MRDTELELELEDLMNVLAESDLESEAAWEAEHDQKIPALRCTTVGKRVGSFVCSPWDLARIIGFLGVPVSPNVLQAAVEAAAGAAVSLATTAAASLDLLNRTNASRVEFCAAFGVAPDFVPAWRATQPGIVNWKDLGELVALRLRDAAKILDGGCIRYFSLGSPAYCAECTEDPSAYFACSSWKGGYTICLGSGFWQKWQAGGLVDTDLTLLHEALHIYFGKTVAHKGRTGNANCYPNFVARANGLTIPQRIARKCPPGSCAPLPATILDDFRIDHVELLPHHTPLVDNIATTVVASWKTRSPIRIVALLGFADSTGAPKNNFDLGEGRAIAARDGIAAAIRRLDPAVAGKVVFIPLTRGADGAIAPNATAAGRAKNRRVEVTLLPS